MNSGKVRSYIVFQLDIVPPYVKAHTCATVGVRAFPGKNYPLIATLNANFNTNIIAKWDNEGLTWFQIYYDSFKGLTGWVKKDEMCEGYWYPPVAYSGSIDGVTASFYNGLAFSRPLTNYTFTGDFDDLRTDDLGNTWTHGGSDYAIGHLSISYFGSRYPICVSGNSIATPVFVYAAADGTVIRNTTDQYGGRYIDIEHPNGMMSRYLHLSDITNVKAGDKVKRGQQIAILGMTGLSTGCHLHFEIWQNGARIDPESVFNSPQNEIFLKIEKYYKLSRFIRRLTNLLKLFSLER